MTISHKTEVIDINNERKIILNISTELLAAKKVAGMKLESYLFFKLNSSLKDRCVIIKRTRGNLNPGFIYSHHVQTVLTRIDSIFREMEKE